MFMSGTLPGPLRRPTGCGGFVNENGDDSLLTSSSGKWQSNTKEVFAASCFVTSTTKFGVDTISCYGEKER